MLRTLYVTYCQNLLAPDIINLNTLMISIFQQIQPMLAVYLPILDH